MFTFVCLMALTGRMCLLVNVKYEPLWNILKKMRGLSGSLAGSILSEIESTRTVV